VGRTKAIAIGVVVVFTSISAAATTDAILPAAGDRTNVDARDQHRALFIGWKEPEGNDGSGVATEDDKDADAEAGEYTSDIFGGRAQPTLGEMFRQDNDNSKDDGHK
jgi:hypothetical protein